MKMVWGWCRHLVAFALISLLNLTPFSLASVLGTPTDEDWPGVTSLPDYKASFPSWDGTPLDRAVPTLDKSGLDLLRRMLIYDPAGRVSGECSSGDDVLTRRPDSTCAFAQTVGALHAFFCAALSQKQPLAPVL